jgi:uncharacterized membrane protein
MKVLAAFLTLFWLVLPGISHAQAEVVPDTVHIERAQVLEATASHATTVAGTNTPSQVQTLKVKVLDGPDKGQVATFENDYPTQFAQGDIFFIRHESSQLDGTNYWAVSDAYRLNVLLILGLVFLGLLFVFGGIQGIRGLASLLGSLVLIFYVLLPGILSGYSPILASIGVSSLVIIVGSYITHGFNKTTSSAVLGMIITVIITGLGAYYVIHVGHFSGYTTEENTYLNFNTQGSLSMIGLLFGGIMIGLLGVLYDIAIGQAVAVEELFRAGKHLARREIYTRAIRIGREHIGALVNTLAIAYVGAALPLLLLLKETYSSSASVLSIINSELFATEIVRILIGSIGLILAVPITTLAATLILEKHRAKLEGQPGHSHGHHH